MTSIRLVCRAPRRATTASSILSELPCPVQEADAVPLSRAMRHHAGLMEARASGRLARHRGSMARLRQVCNRGVGLTRSPAGFAAGGASAGGSSQTCAGVAGADAIARRPGHGDHRSSSGRACRSRCGWPWEQHARAHERASRSVPRGVFAVQGPVDSFSCATELMWRKRHSVTSGDTLSEGVQCHEPGVEI